MTKNIYTILDKINFEDRVNKEIDLLNKTRYSENFESVTSKLVFTQFVFSLMQDFYSEILKNESN